MTLVALNIAYFPDPTIGRPVFNGSVFVGTPGTDPTIEANQKQVTLRQENGTEVPVSQPVLTGAGGVPIFNGSPVELLVDGNYSLTVLNSKDSQVYHIDNTFSGAPVTVDRPILSYQFDTVADMKTGTLPDSDSLDLVPGYLVETKGYYIAGDGGGASYFIVAPQAVDGFGDHLLGNGNVALIQVSGAVHIRQYGVRNSIDSTSELQACSDASLGIFTICGTGVDTILKGVSLKSSLKGGTYRDAGAVTTGSLLEVTEDNVIVSEISTFVDNTTVTVGCSGVFFNTVSNCSLLDSRLDGSKLPTYVIGTRFGVMYAHNCNGIVVERCVGLNADIESFIMDVCSDSLFTECKSSGAPNSNFSFTQGTGNKVLGCIALNSGTSNISINSDDSVVSNNTIFGTTDLFSAGINVGHVSPNTANNCIIIGNTIESCQTGINSSRSSNTLIEGNTVRDSVEEGIRFSDTPINGSVIGNRVFDTDTGNGIRIFNNTGTPIGDYVVSGNTVVSCGSSGINVIGARTVTVVGNSIIDCNDTDAAFGVGINIDSFIDNAVVDGNNIINGLSSNGIKWAVRVAASSVQDCAITNNKTRGWQTAPLSLHATPNYSISGNDLSPDLKSTGVTLVTSSTTTVVTNDNIVAKAGIPVVIGSNAQAAGLDLRISAISDGTFTLLHNAATSGAFVRITIN